MEGNIERVVRYINGLIFEIQYEISLLNLKTVEDAFQTTLRVEEKLLRRQNQKNRGRGSARGYPKRGGKFQTSKDEAEGPSSHKNQRGGFKGGRGRGRHREVKCYTCGEIGHMSWERPRNKTAAQRNLNSTEACEESSEEVDMNNPHEEG